MHEGITHSEGKMLRPMVKFALDMLRLYDDSHFITDKKYAYNAFAEHFSGIMQHEGVDVEGKKLKELIKEYGDDTFADYLSEYLD